MQKNNAFDAGLIAKVFGLVLFLYLFLGFMVFPCLNTLTSIFTTKNAQGNTDYFAVIRFFLAGTMPLFVWNSLKLAICLVFTVNVVGISLVYGVGARDLGERLEARKKWRKRWERLTGRKKK